MKLELVLNMKSPKRLINRWPAIIFAVRRIESVIGRIIFLISSINTIKFINGIGVPLGRV